ncbi:TIGR02281 family clan AA aspartic protease [uncultured Amaricoccus sp.]|uniref:retropepsin-like aspartic protease family protein n=1 Tax=uncultured Amaricoccus sp. TaxID=339341 RepID=UPI0026274FA6|nr:TIGR02281 family clan AA aspartic protease [uncultured Amaricoccus sp.]
MTGDDIAHAIYLVILLVFLLGVFTVGGRNMGRKLRDLLVWVLIFAMVVIAYGFRDRLSEGLFPSGTRQVSADAIELRRLDDGHFHADLEVNGAQVRFIVDTGATQLVLSRDDAAAAGIDVSNLAYLGRAETANGPIATATVRLDEVTFGDFVDHDLTASVGAGDLGVSLLGMDYLNRFAKIEISGDVMRLTR